MHWLQQLTSQLASQMELSRELNEPSRARVLARLLIKLSLVSLLSLRAITSRVEPARYPYELYSQALPHLCENLQVLIYIIIFQLGS